jgi:hypothetical protein
MPETIAELTKYEFELGSGILIAVRKLSQREAETQVSRMYSMLQQFIYLVERIEQGVPYEAQETLQRDLQGYVKHMLAATKDARVEMYKAVSNILNTPTGTGDLIGLVQKILTVEGYLPDVDSPGALPSADNVDQMGEQELSATGEN